MGMWGIAVGTGAAARIACLALLWAFAGPVLSQDTGGGGVDREQIVNSEHFLSAHPDIRWRREAVRSLELGQPDHAAEYFRRAARYADKPSQAVLAELYWNGQGVEPDRVLGYAWMDLAAERAYPVFLAKREQYWAQLTEAERARVQKVGLPLYEQYGDDVAKPRLERLLRRTKRNTTGSRVGAVGNLRIILSNPGGPSPKPGDIEIATGISGHNYYDHRFWEPTQYWAWQDRAWEEIPTGRVDVHPLEPVRDRPDDGPREPIPDEDAP
jgi:uncharacterized protein